MAEWDSLIAVLDKHPSLCVGLASLFSVVFSAVFTAIISWYVRTAEDKSKRRYLAYQAGLDTYKALVENGHKFGPNAKLYPAEVWILSALKLIELVDLEKRARDRPAQHLTF